MTTVEPRGKPPRFCVHYKVPDGTNRCNAGVDLLQFRGQAFDRRPCFLDDFGRSKPGAVVCEDLRRPTPEEIAIFEQGTKDLLQSVRLVTASIFPWREANRGKTVQNVITCPVCDGKLHLSMASNRVHAKCETPLCVAWME